MKKYILIILCCLTSFPLWSYNVNMIVEHYSVDQGLPNNTVNCTLKDRDGFIWFGTWYGLCCFDGVKFKTFMNNLYFPKNGLITNPCYKTDACTP